MSKSRFTRRSFRWLFVTLPILVSGGANGAPTRDEFCASYARSAVEDFEAANRFRKCNVRPDPRWQSDFQNHYKWCMTAPTAWVRSESKARTDHLLHCGARSNF